MTFKNMPLWTKAIDRKEFDLPNEDFFLESRFLAFTTRVIGLKSNVPNYELPYHIFMLDTIPLTSSEYSILRNTCMDISRIYGVSIFIVRSSEKESGMNSYHVISPHTFSPMDIRHLTLQRFTSEADMLFFGLGDKRGFWDLRMTSKGKGTGDSPTLMECILPLKEDILKPVSKVHWVILQSYLEGIPKLKNKRHYPIVDNVDCMNQIIIRYSVSP